MEQVRIQPFEAQLFVDHPQVVIDTDLQAPYANTSAGIPFETILRVIPKRIPSPQGLTLAHLGRPLPQTPQTRTKLKVPG